MNNLNTKQIYKNNLTKNDIKNIIEKIKNNEKLKNYIPKTYLILSGGSSKGFAHLGIIKVLKEIGITPDGIVGTSAGSLIGSIYSYYLDVDKTLEHFIDVKNSKIYEDFANKYFLENDNLSTKHKLNLWVKKGISLTKALFTKQMISYKDMYHLYSYIFDGISFSSLKIPFATCATNILTGFPELFFKGDIVKSIMASTAITVIFPIIEIENNYYTDGGITSNLPVREAKQFFNNDSSFYVGSIVSSPLVEKNINHITSNVFSLLLRIIDISLKNKQFYDSQICDFTFTPIKEDYAWFDFEEYQEFIELGIKEAETKIQDFFISYLEKILSNINLVKNVFKRNYLKNCLLKIMKQ